MPELAQRVVVALIVLGAFVYLVAHLSGAIERFRRKRKPDVPVGSLVRKRRGAGGREDERRDDDCCR